MLNVLSRELSLCPAACPDPPGPAHSRRHTYSHSTADLSPGIEQDQDRAPGLRTRKRWGASVDVRTEWVLGAAPSPRSNRTLVSHWDSSSPLSFPMATPQHSCHICPTEDRCQDDEAAHRVGLRARVSNYLLHLFFIFSLSYP